MKVVTNLDTGANLIEQTLNYLFKETASIWGLSLNLPESVSYPKREQYSIFEGFFSSHIISYYWKYVFFFFISGIHHWVAITVICFIFLKSKTDSKQVRLRSSKKNSAYNRNQTSISFLFSSRKKQHF